MWTFIDTVHCYRIQFDVLYLIINYCCIKFYFIHYYNESANDPKNASNELFRSNNGGVAENDSDNGGGDGGGDGTNVDDGDSDIGIGIALSGPCCELDGDTPFGPAPDTDPDPDDNAFAGAGAAAGKCTGDTYGNVFPLGTVGICGADGTTGCGIICCIIWSNINGEVDSWNGYESW